jgi:hypothetical protein
MWTAGGRVHIFSAKSEHAIPHMPQMMSFSFSAQAESCGRFKMRRRRINTTGSDFAQRSIPKAMQSRCKTALIC